MSKKPTYEEIEQRIVELETEIAELRIRDDSIIKESSTRYSSLFQSVPASIVLIDKNGKIKDINPYHVSHIGKGKTARKDYLNYNILEFPSVVAAGLQDEHKRVLNGESINLKSVHCPLTTGGLSRFFNIRGVPLFKDNKVIGIECLKNELGKPDASGRRRPIPVENSEYVIDCDMIIPAIGQRAETAPIIEETDFDLTFD